jgi:acetoin utilization deacetylase AcuC-like enzyme
MGAVSNGFCILNPVACAAIYATTPLSEGGLGLKRAVVIDFDVHHGNGTQDILCSTNDPRFLYVSMHAGGADINGYESDDSDMDFGREGSKKQEGIYPGRCGDTSPHRGVINLPLGAKVMPYDIGNALVSVVEPAVEAFAPDIVILSAGFDGHKNDPLGMGGLSALDFGHITEVACGMAFRYCSGRIMSVLEGGYGVPCCRAQDNLFLPKEQVLESQPLDQNLGKEAESSDMVEVKRLQPSKLLELDDFLPDEMDDQVTPGMQRKLERCHAEGFVDCVREHVSSLWHNNSRS